MAVAVDSDADSKTPSEPPAYAGEPMWLTRHSLATASTGRTSGREGRVVSDRPWGSALPIPQDRAAICEARSPMNERREPPRHIWYDLEEAIDLLAVLEDAQLTALDGGALALVMVLERQIELLHRKLEIGDAGGADD